MIPSILRSSSHEEALERVSVLNRICQHSHVSRKTVSLTLIAVGIILVISGILLLTLTITSLPPAFSIALGATVLALGTSLASFGVALRILKKPQDNEGEVVLATELMSMKQVVKQKTEEVNRLQGEVSASQTQLAEISEALTTTRELGSNLQSRLDESSQLLIQSRQNLGAVEARLQAAEETLGQTEERLERSQGALEAERAKVGHLEDTVKDLESQLHETSANFDRCIVSHQDVIERFTKDHEYEVSRLTRMLNAKTEELNSALETISQIQRQLSEPNASALSPSSLSPLRKSSSTFSLSKHAGSPTELSSRFAAMFTSFGRLKKSSPGAVIPTSRSSSSSDDQSESQRNQDSDNDTEMAEEASEES
ncbi:IncA family protein [Chlamydia buteonis]|uniref:IncA family protein n=1 Tax=Chlamydia buteonis TaxID=2494525 RepID=A0ABX8LBA9_9CHLA|nr:IncA family protein [Chlamydia buteonis]QXE27083.1 IncA family protein [Chlamydia buteonis]QXE27983.1 IncA family protein [Chlamydia buteonis]